MFEQKIKETTVQILHSEARHIKQQVTAVQYAIYLHSQKAWKKVGMISFIYCSYNSLFCGIKIRNAEGMNSL